MNQILITKKNINRKKFLLIFQLILSIIIVIIIICFLTRNFYNISKQEKFSEQLKNNYNLSKLYANISDNSIKNDTNINELFGIIEIPKINLSYPIFNYLNEDLLKISPCKFYGNSLDKNDNICIAGHNYDNGKFFSNIYLLKPEDEIYLYSNNMKFKYTVISNYEVDANNLSPIFDYDKKQKLLTLVTCNNLNGNRIIIVAKR